MDSTWIEKSYMNIKTLLLLLLVAFIASASDLKAQENPCLHKEHNLYGKVRFVEYASSADIKIKVVEAHEDLRVKLVESFANKCGLWQAVDSFPDLKVYITPFEADLKVKFVSSFPGLRK